MSQSFVDKLKFLLKDSIIYGVTSVVSKFFAIFLTPILTAVLSKDEFGQMDLLTPMVSLLTSFLIFGLDSAVPRFIYDDTKDLKRGKLVASTGFWFQFFLTIGVLLLVYLNRNFLIGLIGENSESIQEFEVIVGLVFFTSFIRYSQNLTRWLLMRKEFLIISLGYIISNFVLVVYFVQIQSLGVYGVFLGQLIATSILCVIGLILIRKQLSFQMDKQLLISMLKYSAPLMLVAFLPAMIPAMDRMAINKYLGLEYIALYGIGYRIMSFVLLPLQSINTALGPFIYNHYQDSDATEVFDKILKLSVIGIFCAIICILSISGFLKAVLADDTYVAGLIVLAPLMLAQGVEFLAVILSVGIELSKKTYLNILVHLGGLITVAIGLFFLTPVAGLWGVAVAILLGKVVQLIFGSWLGTRSYPLKFRRGRVYWELALGVTFLAPHYFYYNRSNFEVLICGLITLILYLATITLMNKKLIFDGIVQLRMKLKLSR